MIVHQLTHFFHRVKGHLVFEPLVLGFYSSVDNVQKAVQYYISKPGFCDNTKAFSVRQLEVKGAFEGPGIFEVIVYFHTDDYEYEYTVELGLFGNEALAYEALTIFVHENRHLFDIEDLIVEKIVNYCILDQREWAEGFSTCR